MKAFFIAAAVLAITLSLTVASAAAAADVNIVTQQAVPIGGNTGTFTMSGDRSDAGTFRFTSFLFTSGQGSAVTTEHVMETWTGSAGTLTVQKECRTVFAGFFATDECQALVTDGAGAYAGLHGPGACTDVLNFVTGIASQMCEFHLYD